MVLVGLERGSGSVKRIIRPLTVALVAAGWAESFAFNETVLGSSFTLTAEVLSFPFPLSLLAMPRLPTAPFSPSSTGCKEFERDNMASSESTCMAAPSDSPARCDDEATGSIGAASSGVWVTAWLLRAEARCDRLDAELRAERTHVRRQGERRRARRRKRPTIVRGKANRTGRT